MSDELASLPCPNPECGGRMRLESGTETAFALRCRDCGEYFYAARRGLVAIRRYVPHDIDAALELVLPASPQEEALQRERLREVHERVVRLEAELFYGDDET